MSNVGLPVPLLWLEHAVETKEDAKSLYFKYFGNYGGNRKKSELLEAVLVEAVDCGGGCYPDALGDCGAFPDAIKKMSKRRELPVGRTRDFIIIMRRASYDTNLECVCGWNKDRCAEEIVILTMRDPLRGAPAPAKRKSAPPANNKHRRATAPPNTTTAKPVKETFPNRNRGSVPAGRNPFDFDITDEYDKWVITKSSPLWGRNPGGFENPVDAYGNPIATTSTARSHSDNMNDSNKQRLRRERDEAHANAAKAHATVRAIEKKLDELDEEREDELKAAYRELEAVRQRLSEKDKEAMRKVQAQAKNVTVDEINIIKREGTIPEDGFISRDGFRKVLRGLALMNEEDDLHVYHIIANNNGGPDHIDNFLWALGASFNISIGDRHDEFNCFLAGKRKTSRAVEVCKLVESEKWQKGNKQLLEKFCKGRARKKFKFYSEGRHKWKTGENLFQKGQSVYGRAIRQAGKEK